MKLYFSPGACSLSPHIVLREAGADFDLQQVDTRSKEMVGSDSLFTDINPKGSVPFLQLDDGEVITEGAVIVQYIGDKNPESGLIPPAGSMERIRVQEWLSFIGSDLHKGFGPIFNPKYMPEAAPVAKGLLEIRLAYVAGELEGKDYLMGDKFTAPDAYLFTILNWAKKVGIDLDQWPDIPAYMARVAGRPAVQETLKAEGLI
ncbi:MAG: glutathione transferase GstA [Alphaproteobacteria bacterium]|nr:glutathione transferase GstA [Alphaproteobacteria bacterium]MBT4086224.1 glutathione transferase GstA [Alphaproteobacteria bacterium]MBT4543841.1 glutathione transferase GstA [Alphaproteobacteria bacterium]MBT7744821.1 glutathione transferase GstA [Alphaproteobacteria bacterium]